MASGEVAYLLGEAYGQQIGTDLHPVLGGAHVYKVTYTTNLSDTLDSLYTNGTLPQIEELSGAHIVWKNSPDGEKLTEVTADSTLFAEYHYVITFLVDGEVIMADTLIYGAAISVPEEPIMEGYTFSGWGEVPETMPAEDIVISASFAVNKYLVTFKIGEEIIVSDSIEYGAAIVVPEAPEKEGHTFSGWGEVAEIVLASDVTYEGTYIVNIYNVYYYVGEELVHTAEVAYGEAIPEYVYEPTNEGEIFISWIGDTYETMPDSDVVYVAEMGVDGITLLPADGQPSTVIYDLQGRRVTNTHQLNGIFIVNGRKVIIK